MFRPLLRLLATTLLVACGGSEISAGNGTITQPGSSQVATVNVTPITALLTVGDTLRLRAATLDAAGSPLQGRVVAWSTEASAIATVSTTGLVTAQAAGSVRISALSEGRTGQATLTITAR